MSKKKKKSSQRRTSQASRKPAPAPKKSKTPLILGICGACLVVAIILAVVLWPKSELGANERYYATIDIRDYGTITVELDHTAAPITVENFVKLARSGFYNGLTFHRIIEGFMMQGGAPATEADKADTIEGEFSANGHQNSIKHERGVISMARANDPNSANSQFFIMHADKTHLDGQYAAFGHVVEGIEVVDAVCEAAKPTDGNGTIPKAEQPVINSITISIRPAS